MLPFVVFSWWETCETRHDKQKINRLRGRGGRGRALFSLASLPFSSFLNHDPEKTLSTHSPTRLYISSKKMGLLANVKSVRPPPYLELSSTSPPLPPPCLLAHLDPSLVPFEQDDTKKHDLHHVDFQQSTIYGSSYASTSIPKVRSQAQGRRSSETIAHFPI